MRYYIYAPKYSELSGGAIVLHRLCHLLNEIDGCEAYLVPNVPTRLSITNRQHFKEDIKVIAKYYASVIGRVNPYQVNTKWNTPVLYRSDIEDLDKSIVVYPETTFGNPLNVKNVVRLLLHQPGFFTKQICYGVGELYYKFNSAIKDFKHSLSVCSDNELKIIYYPLEYYNLNGTLDRSLDCHLVRKGVNKRIYHSSNSIQLDGMSHMQVSTIMKRSKRFISYDPYTAYSIFASLCGCESVVIPDQGVRKEDWYPNECDRYGIAYGLDPEELNHMKHTRDKVLSIVVRDHAKSSENVLRFYAESSAYFGK